MPTLEERILTLEKSRFSINAQINAMNALIIQLWIERLLEHGEPLSEAKRLSDGMLAASRTSGNYNFSGVDPVVLDGLGQETEQQLEILWSQIMDYLRLNLAAKSGTQA